MGSHLSRTTATWKSYLVSSQDPIPLVAKGTEPCAAEMNQSGIEETRAQPVLVPWEATKSGSNVA